MDEPQSPTITLPIHEFLEILWREDDKVYIDQNSHIFHVLKANPNEAIFHLIEYCGSSQVKEATVWRAKDWAIAYERYERSKKESESRVANWNTRQEIKEELKTLIIQKMGSLGVEDSFAETIITTRNVGLALAMGASEDLCKKIQELKQ